MARFVSPDGPSFAGRGCSRERNVLNGKRAGAEKASVCIIRYRYMLFCKVTGLKEIKSFHEETVLVKFI